MVVLSSVPYTFAHGIAQFILIQILLSLGCVSERTPRQSYGITIALFHLGGNFKDWIAGLTQISGRAYPAGVVRLIRFISMPP
jgi:hypothetical protein